MADVSAAPPVRDRRLDRLLRLPDVLDRTGLSTPTIYRRQADGTFPTSVRIGANAVAWYESDINEFVACPFRRCASGGPRDWAGRFS
ncbi:AlpA family phage regulatory protein [Sphingomonas sp. CGMCC 1.13654]|uniref:AlpA family phage regulatory protein n=2 Tax=Sphingomonas chungangi TaxID=2683589 RepID=A0A838L4G5_9SPHN|nr:AlpA family phage regulatory protein [Sphingomonas chungangi]MBA2933917.1 AlpA family phage regulatory protein [Sphingomonas chungangi]MVW57045.1 AlpA family phage regulatory protein [Sphingomonas chungangi]